jgi:hypothetical protein
MGFVSNASESMVLPKTTASKEITIVFLDKWRIIVTTGFANFLAAGKQCLRRKR